MDEPAHPLHRLASASLRLVLMSTAAMAAEAATFPIDTVKTRLQLQDRTATPRTLGALQMAASIVRRDGVAGLYAGLSPALARHVVYTGTRITIYEQLRDAWQARSPPLASGSVELLPKLAMGLTAGALGQLVAVPADLVKVQMQAAGSGSAARKHVEGNTRQLGLLGTLRHILSVEGIAGLWRGAGPAVQRAALVNLGELATYDQAKHTLLSLQLVPEGLPAHVASSVASGLVASLVSTPADVIKTRLMAQRRGPVKGGESSVGSSCGGGSSGGVGGGSTGSGGGSSVGRGGDVLYRGAWDCAVRSVREEGWGVLYKGFFPTWSRLGPWQLVFWVTYEQLRHATGLPTF